MENVLEESKDKIPEDVKPDIDKLIEDAKAIKSKEDATKEEIDKEIERINKELQELMQKFQATTDAT